MDTYLIPLWIALGWTAGFVVFNDATLQHQVAKWKAYNGTLEYANRSFKAQIAELLTENTRLANTVRYGQPQPVHRSIDVATSLRLMGLDPGKSQRDPSDPWVRYESR